MNQNYNVEDFDTNDSLVIETIEDDNLTLDNFDIDESLNIEDCDEPQSIDSLINV